LKDDGKAAKDGGIDFKLMRLRHEEAVSAESENRELALDDLRFVTIPGHTWDEAQRKKRRGRACYEFPILRSHWRQVVNDQKKGRPGIKVRANRDATAKDADLRAGLIRNIEAQSNAELAYDGAFELLSAAGFGAWRIKHDYSADDVWEMDLCIEPIADALSSVWLDPTHKLPHGGDANWGFVEETLSREEFRKRYPKAQAVDFESAKEQGTSKWFGADSVRVAEYWRVEEREKLIALLSDGRTIDLLEAEAALDELQAQGVTIQMRPDGITPMTRRVKQKVAVYSIVSGSEELEGPHETPFKRIPIITCYANRHLIEGKWFWCGMVRFSRDPQKLVNYNLTTGQELLGKQPKAPYLVTPKMLEGKGVKAMWDRSNSMDQPYLPYTPDPQAPQGRPTREAPPDMPAAFTAMTQIAVDMLKASDGIFDASVGARSNETSGKAIRARQQEGDTATFDFQDALAQSIAETGKVIGEALPAVYDTPRQVRVIGRDGTEEFVSLYEDVRDQQTGQMVKVNDLSKGKYDYTVTTGPSYDTQRMEFVDALVQLSQANPLVAQGVPDLIVGAMDFPKADEAAERLKMLLPPPIQAKLSQGKDMPPEVMQAMAQVEQQMQMIQQQAQEMAAEEQRLAQEKAANTADKAGLQAQIDRIAADRRVLQAEFNEAQANLREMQMGARLQQLSAQVAQSSKAEQADAA
jgi:hypothetical protein